MKYQQKKRPTAKWGESGKAIVLVDAEEHNNTAVTYAS